VSIGKLRIVKISPCAEYSVCSVAGLKVLLNFPGKILPEPPGAASKIRERVFSLFIGGAMAGSALCSGIALLTWNKVYSTYAFLQPEFSWISFIFFATVEVCLMLEIMHGVVVNSTGLFLSLFTVLSSLKRIR
jgi:hypothetical protein